MAPLTSHPPVRRGFTRLLRTALPLLLMAVTACDSQRIIGPSPAPRVSSLFPNGAPSDVATTVVLRGLGFEEGATVSIGGAAATDVRIRSRSEITAIFPAHPIGVVDVIVTNPDGRTASLTGGFRYYDLAATPLLVFTDPVSRVATSDLRDAQEQIVRINAAGDLFWIADGSRFPGFTFDGENINAERLCGCWFQIRFGTRNGDRRAFITAMGPHWVNDDTILDLEVTGGRLDWSVTDMPVGLGPNTLSGLVTQSTPMGAVPLFGAKVSFFVGNVPRERTTDRDGAYQIPWLEDGFVNVTVSMPGFTPVTKLVMVRGNTQQDFQLVR